MSSSFVKVQKKQKQPKKARENYCEGVVGHEKANAMVMLLSISTIGSRVTMVDHIYLWAVC